MELSAYYYRIRAMGLAELAGRTARKISGIWQPYFLEREAAGRISACHLRSLLETPLLAGPEPGAGAKTAGEEQVLERAGQALEGRIVLYGIPLTLAFPPDWLANPFENGSDATSDSLPAWRESYGLSGPDIRSIWELNRLQFLVDLGRAFVLTGEIKYAGAVIGLLESWQAANPFGRTINWTNALEAGLRSISILLALSCIREPLAKEPEARRAGLARLLYLHGRYLESRLSYPSSGFNHLAGEAAALALLGSSLDGMPGAERWSRTGERLLNDGLSLLILEDGGPLEGALHYQAFVCRLAVTTDVLCGRKGRMLLGEEARRKLEAAYRFLCAAADRGLAVSEFGDSDRAFLPGPAPVALLESYRGTLNLLALYCGVRPLLHSYQPDAESAWLFGFSEAEKLAASGAAEIPPGLERFDASGHYIVRSGPGLISEGKAGAPVFLRFECGHWGDGRIWAHAHADRLSFSLFIDGLPFFIDPGTGAYLADRRFREFFRSTAAHNTVTVDNHSQAMPRGCFIWSKPVGSSITVCEEQGSRVILEGFHTGYAKGARGGKGLIHRRRLTLSRQEHRLEIEDIFETKTAHRLSLTFMLHPDCTVRASEDNKGVLNITNAGTGLRLTPDSRCRISLHEGDSEPLLGWYSPGFMRIVPCPQIVGQFGIEGDCKLLTIIEWGG